VSRGKADLRASALMARRALAAAAPDAAERAAQHLPTSLLAGAATVSIYRPMRDEIDTAPLVWRLTALGLRILLPAVVTRGGPLAFRDVGAPLVPDAAGIPAPGPGAAAADPDILIVPLLAFDHEGQRLGYGGGYYDRTLEALRARRPVFAIGLAFEGQAVAALPHDGRDQKLDAILTEIGYRRFRDKDR
jgi:5-formyltetrahydrofolate cyclo-ligase